jgi:hypothetical protein
LACSPDDYSFVSVDVKQYSVTATIRSKTDNETWTISVVYGPQGDYEKLNFLDEIKQIKSSAETKWVILGDFNLIYRARDKSNGRVNRRLMSSFQWILDELELKELPPLHGRRFTWTSATNNPTQTKIDHEHPHCHLQALASLPHGTQLHSLPQKVQRVQIPGMVAPHTGVHGFS